MCLYPKLIKNRKYVSNKKNGGKIPPISDERLKYVAVGCGRCLECRKQYKRNWQVRLSEEIRNNKTGIFVTLTFSNQSYKELYAECKKTGYARDNEIAALAVRRFLERWRKKHKKSVRHWLVTELGHKGTENIHLHGIIFTEHREDIKKIWKYGYIWDGYNINDKKENYVNEKTINYIVKYIGKTDEKHKTYRSIVLCSHGIGSNYIQRPDSINNKFKGTETNEAYETRTGIKLSLPIYYRNKIYSEEEREKLWLQRLDKQERWIMGERVGIEQGEDEYYALLEHWRRINNKLGYGSDNLRLEEQEEEHRLRLQKQNERLTFKRIVYIGKEQVFKDNPPEGF